jgi:hypothetical protein
VGAAYIELPKGNADEYVIEHFGRWEEPVMMNSDYEYLSSIGQIAREEKIERKWRMENAGVGCIGCRSRRAQRS